MAEEQTTLWPKEKIPKEYSESVYGRRTDNTMAKRKSTKEYSESVYGRRTDNTMAKRKNTKGVFRIRIWQKNRQHYGQKKKYQRSIQNPYMAEEQTTQWPKEKIQKEYSESVYGRTTDNTMAKRKNTKGVFRIRIWQKNRQHYGQKKKYQRSIQNPYMAEEQTTLWPKEKIPKEYSESVYGRRTDNTMAKRKSTKRVFRIRIWQKNRQHYDQKKKYKRSIQNPHMAEEQTTLCAKEKIPKEYSESVYGRRTDNTMAKRKSTKGIFRIRIWQKNRQHYGQKKKYKRSIQNPYMAEEQTTLWPKEKVQKEYSEFAYGRRTDNTMGKRKNTKGVFRIRIWQKNRQHYGQKKKYKRNIQNPYMAEEQTTLWPKEKVQKEYSESVYGRRTDNTMAKRKSTKG